MRRGWSLAIDGPARVATQDDRGNGCPSRHLHRDAHHQHESRLFADTIKLSSKHTSRRCGQAGRQGQVKQLSERSVSHASSTHFTEHRRVLDCVSDLTHLCTQTHVFIHVFLATHVCIYVRGALLAKGPNSSFGEVHTGSCSDEVHMEEERVEGKVQTEEEVEDRETHGRAQGKGRKQTITQAWYHTSLSVRAVNEKKVTCEVYCLQFFVCSLTIFLSLSLAIRSRSSSLLLTSHSQWNEVAQCSNECAKKREDIDNTCTTTKKKLVTLRFAVQR